MTDPQAAPEADDIGGWHWLDTAGLIAGVVLLLIAADIWTDGKLISNRLHKPAPPAGEQNDQPAGD